MNRTIRSLLRPVRNLSRSAMGINGLSERLDAMQDSLNRMELLVGQQGDRIVQPQPSDLVVSSSAQSFVNLTLADGRPYQLSVDGPDQSDAYQRGIRLGYTADMGWRFLMSWLRPGNVFFDLGANLGVFSIPAAVMGVQVHGFELLDENVRHIVRSVKQNQLSGLSITLGAVWDRGGGVGFAGYSAWGEVRSDSPVSVATIVIDDYVATRGVARVDVMKIDVEGSEKRALLGMSKLIERDHPDILFESNVLTCGGAGYSYREIIDLLTSAGYGVYRLHRDRLCLWDNSVVQEIVCADYFATIKSAAEIGSSSLWPIATMSWDDVIEAVLDQEIETAVHQLYLVSVQERLQKNVLNHGRVKELLEKWAHLPSSHMMETLRVGSA